MPRYPSWPTTDQGNIVGARLANEMYHRFTGGLNPLSFTDQRDAALAELLATTSEMFNVSAFGAKGDGVTDDATAIQSAIDAAVAVNGSVYIPASSANYLVQSTLVISVDNPGIGFYMERGAFIQSTAITAGNFLIELRNSLFCRLRVRLAPGVANGIKIGVLAAAGTQNSLYNQILAGSDIVGNARAGSKPAVGSGTVGILFSTASAPDSNFFNRVDKTRVVNFDTCIRTENGANAQILMDPQLEAYWYGVEFDSVENSWRGGFCHQAPGGSSSELTECLHIGASKTLNFISGPVLEPGANSLPALIETGASKNVIDLVNNTGRSIDDSGTKNSINTAHYGRVYAYTVLEENKQYRLNSLSFPTNNVSAIVILTFSSRNTSTNAASSGESVARVNRDNSGVITIKHLYSSYTRKLSGILEFDGWEINGDNIHPIFTVRNNATSTTSCTASIGIKGIESSRLNTEVVGPSVTAAPSQAGDVFDVDNFSVSAGATITKHISATAALNFDLSGSASQDLTITATGAAVGDTVALGVPNGSVTADTLFWAWVSATNTVTVRAMRIAGTPNPASGTFRVDVWQH